MKKTSEIERLYTIHQEWTEIPDGVDSEGIECVKDSLEWMVLVEPFNTEASLNAYIDAVQKWMAIDYARPKFRIDSHEYNDSDYDYYEVDIVGPFASATEVGEFVDLLMEYDKGKVGVTDRYIISIGEYVVWKGSDYGKANRLFELWTKSLIYERIVTLSGYDGAAKSYLVEKEHSF